MSEELKTILAESLADISIPGSRHQFICDLAQRIDRARPAPAVQVPEGWALVPVEPTPEMLAATSWPGCAATDYEHMLAASPAPATVATEAVPHAYQYGTALMWPDDLSDEDKREALPLYAVATEAVAQGGGVVPQWLQDEDHVSVPRGLLAAACSAIDHKRPAGKVLAMLRHYSLLASPAPVGGWMPDLSYGKHAKEVWVIMFEDADVKPEVFIGEGAEDAARHRFKSNLMNWNCHLLCTAAAPAIAKQSEVGRG